jgi:sulfur carrier protein ThiS
MTTDNQELHFNCLQIEAMVKTLVMQGITDNEQLVAAVDFQFTPKNEWEMEHYSEAIIYAKYSILN